MAQARPPAFPLRHWRAVHASASRRKCRDSAGRCSDTAWRRAACAPVSFGLATRAMQFKRVQADFLEDLRSNAMTEFVLDALARTLRQAVAQRCVGEQCDGGFDQRSRIVF